MVRCGSTYNPVMLEFGRTNNVHREMAIGIPAFRIGRWTVLATLVHELAHINGAPGGNDRRAEEAVLACGMGRRSERLLASTIRGHRTTLALAVSGQSVTHLIQKYISGVCIRTETGQRTNRRLVMVKLSALWRITAALALARSGGHRIGPSLRRGHCAVTRLSPRDDRRSRQGRGSS